MSSSVQGEILVTCLNAWICVGVLLVAGMPVFSQTYPPPANQLIESGAMKAPMVDELRFTGLRRISPGAVAAQMTSHPGGRFEPSLIDKDIRVLARLGWFETSQVEATSSTLAQLAENSNHVILIFHLKELPFLSKVEYSGSRLLSQKQIEKMLEDKKLAPPLGKPADPAALHRIAITIRVGLNELGHPDASVRIAREQTSNAPGSVRFELNAGPLLRGRRGGWSCRAHLPHHVFWLAKRHRARRTATT